MNLKTNFIEMLEVGIYIDNIEKQLLKDVSIKMMSTKVHFGLLLNLLNGNMEY